MKQKELLRKIEHTGSINVLFTLTTAASIIMTLAYLTLPSWKGLVVFFYAFVLYAVAIIFYLARVRASKRNLKELEEDE